MKENDYLPKNSTLKSNSQNLRRNATPQENKLWYEFLRSYPVKFKRQYIIGNYISDFYCRKAKLVIELDGGQHYTEERQCTDKMRTEYIEQFGIKVLRFPNCDVDNYFYEVCSVIDEEVKRRSECV